MSRWKGIALDEGFTRNVDDWRKITRDVNGRGKEGGGNKVDRVRVMEGEGWRGEIGEGNICKLN